MDNIKKDTLSREYIAGFIDGEGYIGITFQRKKETSYQSASAHYHPYLIIANNNYEILNDIKKFVGSGLSDRVIYTSSNGFSLFIKCRTMLIVILMKKRKGPTGTHHRKSEKRGEFD